MDYKYSIDRVSTAYSCAKSVKILPSVPRKLILLILIQGYFSPNFVINQYYALLAQRSCYGNTTRYSKQHPCRKVTTKEEFSINPVLWTLSWIVVITRTLLLCQCCLKQFWKHNSSTSNERSTCLVKKKEEEADQEKKLKNVVPF